MKNAGVGISSDAFFSLNCAGALDMGRRLLSEAGVDDPLRDATTLLCAAAGCDRAALLTRSRERLPESVCLVYYSYLKRRVKKEPVQYIIGEWEFMGLPFVVNRDVLIPRPDTECLVDCVLSALRDRYGNAPNAPPNAPPNAAGTAKTAMILDLCTGSGCVAVSLAFYCKNVYIIATDISEQSLRVAKANAELNRVDGRIVFAEGDLYAPVEAAAASLGARAAAENAMLYDVICANPPYVACEDWDKLPEDVRLYEPRIALDGGYGGMDFYDRIAEGAARRLKPGGLLAVETGDGQAPRVARIFAHNGFTGVRTIYDINGLARVVSARRG